MPALPPDIRQSTLLNALGWVQHGFLPPGVRPPAATAWGQQRHTPQISEAEQNFPPKQVVSDGVFSRHGRPVAVYTADCLPVLIACQKTRHLAAVHGGLKGTLAGVLQQALATFQQAGSAMSDLWVAIGPAIGPCCYELGLAMGDEIEASRWVELPVPRTPQPWPNPASVRDTAPITQPGFWLDLPAMATTMLINAGVPAAHIDNLNCCTYCMASTGSSYRRNTHTGEGYQLRFSWIGQQPLSAE